MSWVADGMAQGFVHAYAHACGVAKEDGAAHTPVNASIRSDTPTRMRPIGLSAPPFFFLPPKLKMHTPIVMSATCTYSKTE